MERFAESWEGAQRRVPALRDVEIAKVVNGPEAFTPDGEFILGETAEVTGLWVAAGFCVHGLAGAGGVGRVIAEWIVEGMPWVDPRRWTSAASARTTPSAPTRGRGRSTPTRATTTSSTRTRSATAGRPLRLPPAYERLRELDASFGEKAGWERVNWFELERGGGRRRRSAPTAGPGRNWSPAIGAECIGDPRRRRALRPVVVREARRRGPGRAAALGRICANEIDKPVGSAVYTQLLNDRGGIEADLTVTRVGEESFRVVTGTAFGTRDLAWIRRHLPNDGSVQAVDVSALARLLLPLGPARPRDPPAAGRRRPLQRGAPVPAGPPDQRRRRPRPRAADHLRRRARLGALLPGRVRPRALGPALARRARAHGMRPGRLPRDRLDAAREGLPRLGRSTSRPRRPRTRRGSASRSSSTRTGGFIGRDALLEQREGEGPERAPALPRPRRAPLGLPRRRAGPGRTSEVARPRHLGRLRPPGRAQHRLRLPARRRSRSARASRSGIFGRWVGAEVAREPLYDPKMERVRA